MSNSGTDSVVRSLDARRRQKRSMYQVQSMARYRRVCPLPGTRPWLVATHMCETRISPADLRDHGAHGPKQTTSRVPFIHAAKLGAAAAVATAVMPLGTHTVHIRSHARQSALTTAAARRPTNAHVGVASPTSQQSLMRQGRPQTVTAPRRHISSPIR